MMERRTIVGYIDKHIATNEHIAFPEALVRLKEPGVNISRPGSTEFPPSGTAYLHTSAIGGIAPPSDHFGLFECVESGRDGSAKWQVSRTLDSLSLVVPVNVSLKDPPHLYKSLENLQPKSEPNILLGDGKLYCFTQDECLIGPFSRNLDRWVASSATKRWVDTKKYILPAERDGLLFVNRSTLPTGVDFPANLRAACARLLRVAKNHANYEWLSRSHIADLARELSTIPFDDDIVWLVPHFQCLLPDALEVLSAHEQLTSDLVKNSNIRKKLNEAWQSEHADLAARLADAKSELDKVKEKSRSLSAKVKEQQAKSAEISKEIKTNHELAENAYNEKLRELSENPASIAILGSIFESKGSGIARNSETPQPPFKEKAAPADPLPTDLALHRLGMNKSIAIQTTQAALAALCAGQVVCIDSPVGELIATAIFCGLSHKSYHMLDVPAGLLDPVFIPDSLLEERRAFLFKGSNRSDLGLVLSALLERLSLQGISPSQPQVDVILLLDSRPQFTVNQPHPPGILIDRNFAPISRFADCSASFEPSLGLIEHSDVRPCTEPGEIEELITGYEKLSVSSDSYLSLMARRYFDALKAIGVHEEKLALLFIKFWLIPQLDRNEYDVLAGLMNKELSQDKQLNAFLEECRK